MDFQKVTEAIEKSSPEIKNLMFSVGLGEKVTDIAFENNLDEEIALKLSDEVGYVILGLKSRTSFFDSLVEIGIKKNVASSIAKEVELKIFSELDKIKITPPIQEPPTQNNEEPVPNRPDERRDGVGQSFEQIILNQAKAMQPAVPADRIMNHELGIMNEKKEPPNNLPTSEVPHNLPTYKPGEDPYHEPIA